MSRNAARIPLLMLAAAFGPACDDGAAPLPLVKTATGQMVLVPGGWFTMGSDRGEADERPPRKVWVDAFLIDRYEVTQEQFGRLSQKLDPSHFKGKRNPVENVTWPVVVLYCNARSRAEGLEPCYDEKTGECNFDASGYRLPTEAEWECACRAGSNAPYFFGPDARRLKDHAWLKANASGRTHPVGSRRPNPWGIYDMCGNVTEWCNDVYGRGYYAKSPERNPRGPAYYDLAKHVVRGGAWNTSAEACRSARRAAEDPGEVDGCFSRGDIGFRCVRNAPDQSRAEGDPD